ncbi:TPA: hypothetical protein MXR76_005361 [Pseudomonas aeruginosa]|uniref:hypothetical protein n=1 Tax=Pseudomonas aeruginosa TaxID=287 RepID=UPI00093E8012|nr:hypothetical protein [Pseudomonas aeruginosa]EKF7416648.1 hypothetical protein [Pseudomonas aeruginosa]CAI9794677.1 Rx-N domain-containing protein [Pseudomonas aeruginosa]CAI9912066.1 Rx-N domain-containing protein [Pseudomonas aeruginosa]HBO1620038.1 hypothetical protein [Pseudomonas aeruginosa]HBO9385191.1 hypothetical protein [Pseudomonas aeruginosa]
MKSAIKLALEALELAAECGGELDHDIYVEAQQKLQAMADDVVKYDRKMDSEERAPDGHDYNELLSVLGLATAESQAAVAPAAVAA